MVLLRNSYFTTEAVPQRKKFVRVQGITALSQNTLFRQTRRYLLLRNTHLRACKLRFLNRKCLDFDETWHFETAPSRVQNLAVYT